MLSLRHTFLALAAAAAVTSGCAHADRPLLSSTTAIAPSSYQLLSVEVVSDYGSLPAYLYGGSAFIEGQHGARYSVRLTNNSPDRVEAVLAVDGRDVVSGELGNYKKQRGYVIEPWDSVLVDGFRQSLDQVAAFRFSELQDSYTARRGTPQHAGVIGVAVFREKVKRQRNRNQPIAVGGRPYYEEDVDYRAGEAGAPFPDAAPTATDDEASSRPLSKRGAFAPSPVPRNDLGTAYGESRTSIVHETRFKRRHARRPDALLTVFYDSHEGLQARGVVPASYYRNPYDLEPFPGPYASPPPPVWR